jgi:DNA-binding NarL/FixJ family response regulator
MSPWVETMPDSIGEQAAEDCPSISCPVCQLARLYRLTPTEVQVIALLGLKNKAIARVLGCSSKTVDRHVRRISAKTGAENKLRIGLWAIAKRMVRISEPDRNELTPTLS